MSGALAGQRVLVTGASRGIGRAVSVRLAREGAEVVVASRDARALQAVLEEMEPRAHAAVALDVTDRSAWQDALEIIAPGGFLSGVVTAAASLTPIGPIGSWDVEEFRRTVDVNLVGTLLAVESSIPSLRSSRGSVVAFSGGGATGPFPRYDAYAASKVAVVRLAENLAAELRSQGVRVNCVAPGFVLTDMHQATLTAGAEQAGREYFDRTARALASGGGDPPELAVGLVSFLLSRASEPITGKLISARWDRWQDESFQTRLAEEADFATLRRIDDQFFTQMHAAAGGDHG
jgi:NAD(P)-dependent dehydrogenase (short-subunit alcohol dehydrogenase family)